MNQTTTTTTISPFKPNCLQGKVAVVTGGASGICYQITRQLLSHGCTTVLILGRRPSFLKSSSRSLLRYSPAPDTTRVLYKVCDVRNPSACAEAIAYLAQETDGRIDILINGAAGNFLAEAGNTLSPKGFSTVLRIDAEGTYNMCHAAYPYLKGSRGCVVNISATLQYGATWYQAHVSAAKAAVDSLTRSLGLEWGKFGVRVNGIAPGPIKDTPGMVKLAPVGEGKEEMEEMVVENIPIGRMGTGFDIGMASVFLCCEASGGFITGETLVVDGGEWMYKPPVIPREMVEELSRGIEKKSRDLRPSDKIKSKL